MITKKSTFLLFISIVMLMLLIVSGINPFDRTTWMLEVFPIFIVLPVLWLTHRNFPLTTLLYFMILLHSVVLMIGGKYSYARVPLGFHIQDILHLSRNPYDKIGHFFQGFVPALVVREVFIRTQMVTGQKAIAVLSVCVVLAFSATYEIFEWITAIMLGQGADEFLGTQGDTWDTQSDMLFALMGGVFSMLFLAPIHNIYIARLDVNKKASQPDT